MHILKVSPNTEFKVRDELHRFDMPALVPVEFAVSVHGKGRKTIRRTPVVRGYVFAGVGANDWHRVSAIRDVHGALWVDGRPARLTPLQVSAVEMLSRPIEDVARESYKPGDRVRIRRGAWAELQGVVTAIERGRVVVGIELFGRVSEAKVPASNVEAA